MKIILLICSMLLSLEGLAGNSVLNGGDSVSIEFVAIARIALADLTLENLSGPNQETAMQIKAQIDQIKVYSQDRTFLTDGQEVDAINEPQAKKITVGRFRWSIQKNHMRQRLQLVLHEYIGVLGYDDNNYVLSQPLLEALKPETIAKVTSQRDYLEHLDFLMELFDPYNRSKIPSPAQICMDAGEMKSEWRAITQIYDGNAWYSDVAAADHTKRTVGLLIENFQEACLKTDSPSESLQEWGKLGLAFCGQLSANLMR
jgi:hypothetical protein